MRLVLLLVFALLAGGVARGVDAAGKDLYKVLGIDRGADDRTVKKMYRKLALEHHPDKGGDPEAFRTAKFAFDRLCTPEGRARASRKSKPFSITVPFSLEELFREHAKLLHVSSKRHSKPALRNTSGRPSASAWRAMARVGVGRSDLSMTIGRMHFSAK